jgi:hypothetical protein
MPIKEIAEMEYQAWPLLAKKRFAITQTFFTLSPPTESAPAEAEETNPKVCAEVMLKWFYETLTTLDTKSSALMRLNGVLIAACAFLLGLFHVPEPTPGTTILSTSHPEAFLIITSAFLSALSIGCCLFVVNVSWPFLGRVVLVNGKFDCRNEIISLSRACAFRQTMYRAAWVISCIAVLEFVIEFGFQTFHVIM